MAATLAVQLDDESKAYLTKAAELRRMSISEYVRSVAVAQAKRDLLVMNEETVVLTPDEQLAFWNALHEPVKLTESQKKLSDIMMGKN